MNYWDGGVGVEKKQPMDKNFRSSVLLCFTHWMVTDLAYHMKSQKQPWDEVEFQTDLNSFVTAVGVVRSPLLSLLLYKYSDRSKLEFGSQL
ncbi:hypothetical protein V6N13_141217 [Hibiscus sabdariffa]|uniref:Uncharacterized protein n=1 Tax=Hibiscus sabdariffa TaxID=183260 RepID=A0ABR2Q0I7_9ROSI